jgi:hypothetical protein
MEIKIKVKIEEGVRPEARKPSTQLGAGRSESERGSQRDK